MDEFELTSFTVTLTFIAAFGITKAATNLFAGAPSDRYGRKPVLVAGWIIAADEEGVGALSMRNLARRLGYEVMSLYNHVANENELLSLMVDAVASESTSHPLTQRRWPR